MDEGRVAEGGREGLLVPEPLSAPPVVEDFEDTFGEVDEDEYEETIEWSDSASKPIFEDLHTEWHPRGSSFASSTLSLSPTIFPDPAPAHSSIPHELSNLTPEEKGEPPLDLQ